MSTSSTTYAPPAADLERSSDAETERRAYLRHETAVRSVGSLYLLGAVFTGVITLALTVAAPRTGALWPVVVYGGITAGLGAVTIGLYRLDPRVRLPVGLLSCAGLLAVPLGTVINAYVLYLLFSRKGQHVFTPDYREIVARTPHIRYQTSPVALVLILLLALGLLAFLLWSLRV